MSVYYNENDPFTAAWLRELIKAKQIAFGEVDSRNIEDIPPKDLEGFTQHHFFAGIGGWSYALQISGWPDDKPVWTGSCPCQPFSKAGKGAGVNDERHLWPAWYWLIRQYRPAIIFGEQVSRGTGKSWFDLVSTDLENANYACGAANLSAASAGYPHQRERLFWVATSSNYRCGGRKRFRGFTISQIPEFAGLVPPKIQITSPSGPYQLCDDGVSNFMGILRGFGNAIVPQVAAAFIRGVM